MVKDYTCDSPGEELSNGPFTSEYFFLVACQNAVMGSEFEVYGFSRLDEGGIF